MPKSNASDATPHGNRAEIADALRALVDEMRVLRKAVDELREEVQYGVRNLFDPHGLAGRSRRITSMPADPAATDFADRVNRFRPEDLPPDNGDKPTSGTVLVDGQQFVEAIERLGPEVADALTRGQTVPIEVGHFSEAMDDVEQLVYCCEQPKLQWYGDPDHPGISCANCGFPVAHEGDILCWRETTKQDGAADAAAQPPKTTTPPGSPQRELF